uniref:Membrane-associated tyrosine- and threonine-specific cdc2-inhibitory kinase wee-1.3 n=1 Tax=Syphacia muris TaxID=451379 RepID=A0A0N5AC12_9BILA
MTEPACLSPLPRPTFFEHLNPPLSTKREKQRKGIQKRVPRAVRSVQSVSRFLSECYELHGPHFISFTTKGKTVFGMLSYAENGHYNKNDPREYFEQCFERERKIGEGSFGEVFRVKSKNDGKYYAVKRTIEPFRNSRDRELKLREVQKHELLPKHPNLVEFKCAWEEKGQLYIQTELCEYSLNQYLFNKVILSLSDYAERVHYIPEDELWGYFADMVAAVHHLHEQDLLHLDIKPENIFVSNNMCKLGDFGLVFDMKRDSNMIAQDGDSKYLAQEVLNNPPGKPADIFSLGISMLELASDLDLPSRGEGWHMLREGHIPEEFTKDMSPKLRRLIFLMMELNPEKRPTARELFNDDTIQHYLRKRYPLNYSMVCVYGFSVFARFAKQTWTTVLFFLWIVVLPLCLPTKWLSDWLMSQKHLKTHYHVDKQECHNWTPPLKRQKFCTLTSLNMNGGSNKDSSHWSYSEPQKTLRDMSCSPPLFKTASRCGERSKHGELFSDDSSPQRSTRSTCTPTSREMTPEISDRSSSVEESGNANCSDVCLSPTTRSWNNSTIARISGSSSPLSSRYSVQKDFSRNVMSAPVRRPPFRFLRCGKLRSVPKLDFSLADDDDQPLKSSATVRSASSREVTDRGSSADELQY